MWGMCGAAVAEVLVGDPASPIGRVRVFLVEFAAFCVMLSAAVPACVDAQGKEYGVGGSMRVD